MKSIQTSLTTSGNSVAVRLPKELLVQSGLLGASRVQLAVVDDTIVLKRTKHPREKWATEIKALLESNEARLQEFEDMDAAAMDGLDELPWDGPSFEEWQRNNG